MRAYRVEVLIIDHDNLGGREIKNVIENSRYPNRCILPTVISSDHVDVDWSDNHPLNITATMRDSFNDFFPCSSKNQAGELKRLKDENAELKMQVTDMRASLRSCFNSSKGALDQYNDK